MTTTPEESAERMVALLAKRQPGAALNLFMTTIASLTAERDAARAELKLRGPTMNINELWTVMPKNGLSGDFDPYDTEIFTEAEAKAAAERTDGQNNMIAVRLGQAIVEKVCDAASEAARDC